VKTIHQWRVWLHVMDQGVNLEGVYHPLILFTGSRSIIFLAAVPEGGWFCDDTCKKLTGFPVQKVSRPWKKAQIVYY